MDYQHDMKEVRASQLAQASERVGSPIPAPQGFQPCCEAGIGEPTLSQVCTCVHIPQATVTNDRCMECVYGTDVTNWPERHM